MTKKTVTVGFILTAEQTDVIYRHNRGVIKDNALQALLHDRLFHQRIEKKRKGKGSYQRKPKYVGKYFEKPDYQVFEYRNFIIGLLLSNKMYA